MSAFLYALPALALLAALLLGRYPGERLIFAAVARARRRPRRAPQTAPRLASLDRATLPRGGKLLARALAGRPPPHGRRIPLPWIP
jgi:hypothetical protein